MARSTRLLFNNVSSGVTRHNHNWDPIHKSATVIITAAIWQVNALGSGELDGRPWLLDDHFVYVTNIGPHDPEGGPGGVEFFLHAEFPPNTNPLSVIVTITVLEDVEDFQPA